MGEGAGRDIPGSRDQRSNASRPQTRAMAPRETENKDSSDFCDLNWKRGKRSPSFGRLGRKSNSRLVLFLQR